YNPMANMLRSWMTLAALVACLLVCLSSFADAYPPQPESPGSNASSEDWAKYHAAVRHYVNLITRQSKESSEENIRGSLLCLPRCAVNLKILLFFQIIADLCLDHRD
uniref:Uncharacterized protein n=1 Tax=Cyclopterus lumpus TaxID=8103 RepID=A0A8C3B3S6_CYCLU